MGTLARVIAGAVVLLAVAFVAATLAVDRLTASALEENTGNALGVPASVDGAAVSLLTGSFTLSHLRISNPEGFDAPEVIRLETGEGSIRLPTFFSEVVELPRLTLSGVDLFLERRDGTGNYEPILAHYVEEGRHLGDPDRRYVIGELVVRDATLHLDAVEELGEEARLSVPMEELRLTGVGEEDAGLMMQEVVGVLVDALFEAALERAAAELPGLLLRELRERLRDLEFGPP